MDLAYTKLILALPWKSVGSNFPKKNAEGVHIGGRRQLFVLQTKAEVHMTHRSTHTL